MVTKIETSFMRMILVWIAVLAGYSPGPTPL